MRAFLLVCLCACTRENDVRLTFTQSDRVPNGFTCRDSAMVPLAQRAVVDRVLRVSFVVDFIGFNGQPSCLLPDILAFCVDQGCARTQSPPRVCVEKTRLLGPAENTDVAITAMLRDFAGAVLTEDAPDQTVIIRVVASAQTCQEIGNGGFEATELVGCVFSCPAQLDLVSGDVTLFLPAFNTNCEPQVRACAGEAFSATTL